MSTYREIGIFRTQSKIQDGALWKNNYTFELFSQKYFFKTPNLKSLTGF